MTMAATKRARVDRAMVTEMRVVGDEEGEGEVAEEGNDHRNGTDGGDVGPCEAGHVEEAGQHPHVEKDRLGVAHDHRKTGKETGPFAGAGEVAVLVDRFARGADHEIAHDKEGRRGDPAHEFEKIAIDRENPCHAKNGEEGPDEIAERHAQRERPCGGKPARKRTGDERDPDGAGGDEEKEDPEAIEGQFGGRDGHAMWPSAFRGEKGL